MNLYLLLWKSVDLTIELGNLNKFLTLKIYFTFFFFFNFKNTPTPGHLPWYGQVIPVTPWANSSGWPLESAEEKGSQQKGDGWEVFSIPSKIIQIHLQDVCRARRKIIALYTSKD